MNASTGLRFNTVLESEGISPSEVRLIRHQQTGSAGLTSYVLWRDNLPGFEVWQSCQLASRAGYFEANYWASFVVPPDGSTLFVGVYRIGERREAPPEWVDPLFDRPLGLREERPCHLYGWERTDAAAEYVARLRIEWGGGTRSWVQKADSRSGNKKIIELARAFQEDAFPGYSAFLSSLATLPSVPSGWHVALAAARGIYLLTCPRTKEQYVGSAYGADGFWGRWQAYLHGGHGGNVGLKSRDPSDYQISILEVVGSLVTVEEIIAVEQRWKAKLQSREMGLNRN